MKSRLLCQGSALLLCCLSQLVWTANAQHAHIYAGATNQTPGTPLWFVNGDLWDTNSYGGYAQSPACIFLERNIPDFYPGLYQSATTFSALPATIFTGGPSPNAAALGTYVELRFVSLQGPPGGALAVWDENINPLQPTAMFTLPVGAANGTNRFNLSEGNPFDPESDPYGHIHGRRITVTKPGLYTLGLQLVDTANNGGNGGPVQLPSPITYFYLQAGLTLSNFSKSNNIVTARFGLPSFTDYALETSTNAAATNWTTISTITGTSHSELRWVTDPSATAPTRFYRLRKTTQ
jgi:hypothetical protein